MRRALLALPIVAAGLVFATPATAQSGRLATVCVTPCDPGPDIEVHYLSPLSYFTSGTQTLDFGSTPVGTPVNLEKIAIGATEGLGDLTISSITVPSGFTYIWGPNIAPDVEAAGASHGTKIKCNADAPGTYTGNMVITSDDPDESPFTIALTCTVTGGTTTDPTTAPTTPTTGPATTADQGGEDNSTPSTADEGSGAGLPTTGTSMLQSILLGVGLLLVGGSAGLLARRRA